MHKALFVGIEAGPTHQEDAAEFLRGALEPVDEVVVAADVDLDGAALADLLTMTPGRRHLDDDVLALLPNAS